jgi:hypothetical protein
MNVILLAPLWLQLTHLLVAEVFWILLVLASADHLFAHQRSGVPLSPLSLKTLGHCYETTASNC